MGLTRESTGKKVLLDIADLKTNKKSEKIIALAGNPNVGKSTIFNTLTGMHQHTGNWSGKTVKSAIGNCKYRNNTYLFVDLPGCYSLKARSPEEEIARDFIRSDVADITIVVCDATSLERNLNLVLQILETTDNVIVCLNLMDEARKKNISIDAVKLSTELNVPVVCTNARKKNSVSKLLEAIHSFTPRSIQENIAPYIIYPDYIEGLLYDLSKQFEYTPKRNRLHALDLLEKNKLTINHNSPLKLQDDISVSISKKAETISQKCVNENYSYTTSKELKADKILTGKSIGFLAMFVFFLTIFWITISGANYPSALLNQLFSSLQNPLYNLLISIHLPQMLCEMLTFGAYNILTKIIAVMLPPMAIFFPLFTLLEDVGYLPRIAFNLDKGFQKCSSCGKQALTMCMGFGCNSAGVVGCRIIDSPRERLIAIITNSFIPCNGRFPAIISIILMFFVAQESAFIQALSAALILTITVTFAILFSMLASYILSKTILKGYPSSFVLELPPYRRPQIGKIIIRSLFDRTIYVLGRAIVIALPAGIIIWILANLQVNDLSIIFYISSFLDPLGKLMGLDGVILTAFIIGFPANEIVIPLILMMYNSSTILADTGSLNTLKELLTANGWTYVTAINTIIFMLMHWPCSTTCLTIKAETKSWKWTIISIILPLAMGVLICILTNLIL